MTDEIKHPDIEVQLTGLDGNAMFIIGRVSKALRIAGVPGHEISQFAKESMNGDYDNVLITAMRWVSVS